MKTRLAVLVMLLIGLSGGKAAAQVTYIGDSEVVTIVDGDVSYEMSGSVVYFRNQDEETVAEFSSNGLVFFENEDSDVLFLGEEDNVVYLAEENDVVYVDDGEDVVILVSTATPFSTPSSSVVTVTNYVTLTNQVTVTTEVTVAKEVTVTHDVTDTHVVTKVVEITPTLSITVTFSWRQRLDALREGLGLSWFWLYILSAILVAALIGALVLPRRTRIILWWRNSVALPTTYAVPHRRRRTRWYSFWHRPPPPPTP